MPQWTAFAVLTGVVLVVLLVLTRLTQAAFPDDDSGSERDDDPAPERGDDHLEASSEARASRSSDPARSIDQSRPQIDDASHPIDRDRSNLDPTPSPEIDRDEPPRTAGRTDTRDHEFDPESLSTGALLANVAASQGLFALVLVGGAVYFSIPAGAFGIDVSWSSVQTGLLWGTAFGFALYVANEIAAATATWLGFDHDEQLRELLAPDSMQGWALLLGVVLPIIAVFEELLFRAALIGVLSTGFAIDPWLLAVVSSVAFALGHGMQGSVGVVVTGLLGFVLAAGFIVTGSFLVVVVAHYWINALEFVVHEGLGFEWAEAIERA